MRFFVQQEQAFPESRDRGPHVLGMATIAISAENMVPMPSGQRLVGNPAIPSEECTLFVHTPEERNIN